jgi:hypothetical protein
MSAPLAARAWLAYLFCVSMEPWEQQWELEKIHRQPQNTPPRTTVSHPSEYQG